MRTLYTLDPEPAKARAKRQYISNPQDRPFRGRDWSIANPEKRRVIDRNAKVRRYGLEYTDIEVMYEAQGKRCAICPAVLPLLTRDGLMVDHDHATGEVRGLLCRNCNFGIGHFRDNPSLLLAAINYLEAK